MSIKLFEIPIYAFTEKYIINKTDEIKKKCIDDGVVNVYFFELMTIPYKYYKHNHIVGYIDIFIDSNDVSFKVYTMYQKRRYLWNSNKKTYLRDNLANGLHFSIVGLTNEQIAQQIDSSVKTIINMEFKNRCADLEQFELLVNRIDFIKIVGDKFEKYSI